MPRTPRVPSMISARPSAHPPGHLVGRDRLGRRPRPARCPPRRRHGPRIAQDGRRAAVGRRHRRARRLAVARPRHTDPEHFLDAVLIALEELVPGVLEATFDDDPSDRAADGPSSGRCGTWPRPPATVVLDDLHMIDRSRTTDLLIRLVGAMDRHQPAARDLQPVRSAAAAPPVPLGRRARRAARERPALQPRRGRGVLRAVPRGRSGGRSGRTASPSGPRDGPPACSSPPCRCGARRPEGFVERFTGSDRHVADFLLDEVLLRQPDDVREFLLATSVLERLRSDLCAHVTGRDDAGALLRRVESENLFVVPLDNEREWFRYHHLFAQLLRRELRVTVPTSSGGARAGGRVVRRPRPADPRHRPPPRRRSARRGVRPHHHAARRAARVGRHETVRSWLARLPDSFVDATPEHQLLLTLAYSRSGEIEVGRRGDRAGPGDGHARAARRGRAALRRDGRGDDRHPRRPRGVHRSRARGLGRRRDEVDVGTMTPGMATAVRELWGYLPAALARAYALLDDRAGVRRWVAVMRRQGPACPATSWGRWGPRPGPRPERPAAGRGRAGRAGAVARGRARTRAPGDDRRPGGPGPRPSRARRARPWPSRCSLPHRRRPARGPRRHLHSGRGRARPDRLRPGCRRRRHRPAAAGASRPGGSWHPPLPVLVARRGRMPAAPADGRRRPRRRPAGRHRGLPRAHVAGGPRRAGRRSPRGGTGVAVRAVAAPDDRRRWFEARRARAPPQPRSAISRGRGGRSARSPQPPSGRARRARSSKRASTCSTRPRCRPCAAPRARPTGTSGWSSR